MGLFGRREEDTTFPKGDRGSGDFGQYDYALKARRKGTVIQLAGSDPHQEELRAVLEAADASIETAMSPRTVQQEGVDAPIEVRLFTGRRVSGVVGRVPRGLEAIVDETLRRLEDAGSKPRIPVRIVEKRGVLRVELLMGAVR
ncbi:hypothetical protein [uncultured Schumannella sp.]|uniref:hypothetical protein n=1 Tax=uncultured Schumannella sp. TaxID=1195956 RepID=UPI002600C177|nr:hypothetical protein [uncultured Schumannella sp.]